MMIYVKEASKTNNHRKKTNETIKKALQEIFPKKFPNIK